jgi:hypothetical protein
MDEAAASIPTPVDANGFNPNAVLPYGLTTDQIRKAMDSFTSFLATVNQALYMKQLDRLESILMPANFSSIVGEFVGAGHSKVSSGVDPQPLSERSPGPDTGRCLPG